MTDPRLLLLAPGDTVFVLRDQIAAGELIQVEGEKIRVQVALGLGHKIARKATKTGDKIIKYGAPIGSATQPIAIGDHVHTHNLKSDYTATHTLEAARAAAAALP
jgi:SAF domain